MLSVNNIDIAVETFGNNKDNVIILIAGAMAPMIFWQDQFCEKLAKNFFVIRFDNRDFGRSTHFPTLEIPPYTIDDMVEDIKGLLDYFEIHSATVVGHSLGGSIAQLFTVKYPDRVNRLIAISSPIIAKDHLPFVETDPGVLEQAWKVLMANHCYEDYERGKEDFLNSHVVLNGKYPIDKEMSYRYTKYQYDTEPVIEPHLNHTNIQRDVPDIFEPLNKVDIPILFIHGTEDYFAANPENVVTLASNLKNARYVLLKDTGHMFMNSIVWEMLYDSISAFLLTK